MSHNIVNAYPELFDKDKSGKPMGNVYFPDGWALLVEEICEMLMREKRWRENKIEFCKKVLEEGVAEEQREGYESQIKQLQDEIEDIKYPRITQIKEKFGSLRVYFKGTDNKQDAKVEFAEDLSRKICMSCGKPAEKRVVGSWLSVFCDEHHQEELKRRGIKK